VNVVVYSRLEKLGCVAEDRPRDAARLITPAVKSASDSSGNLRYALQGVTSKSVSSIFLRREFGVQVWATDLWFSASENIQRIRDAGVEDGVFPIQADARSLPFAAEFFDAIVCIDSFARKSRHWKPTAADTSATFVWWVAARSRRSWKISLCPCLSSTRKSLCSAARTSDSERAPGDIPVIRVEPFAVAERGGISRIRGSASHQPPRPLSLCVCGVQPRRHPQRQGTGQVIGRRVCRAQAALEGRRSARDQGCRQ
jgi:hypothetical protein